jgi:hypothetical protein
MQEQLYCLHGLTARDRRHEESCTLRLAVSLSFATPSAHAAVPPLEGGTVIRTHSTRTLALTAILAIASLTVAFAQGAAAKIDVTGAWTFEVVMPANTATPTVKLSQQNDKITGTYSSPRWGDVPLTGTIKGDAIALTFNPVQKTPKGEVKLEVKMEGKVEGNKAMKGTVAITPGNEGTFSATRQ